MRIKVLFIACLICAHGLVANCQRYALLDRSMKLPILYTDSVSAEHISRGLFPVETIQVDTLVSFFERLNTTLSINSRSKLNGYDIRMGTTKAIVKMYPAANGDSYDVVW